MTEPLDVIEIAWDGPFGVEDVVSRMHGAADYGIYQLYGTHSVHGADSLLYIGKAQERSFGQRLREHQNEWTEWEASGVTAYLGRLGGTTVMTKDRWPEWEDQIARAERLLIYFCSPPYNSSGVKTFSSMRPTMVLNHKRRYRLPQEISTLLWTTTIGTAAWKVFGSNEPQPGAAADATQAARR